MAAGRPSHPAGNSACIPSGTCPRRRRFSEECLQPRLERTGVAVVGGNTSKVPSSIAGGAARAAQFASSNQQAAPVSVPCQGHIAFSDARVRALFEYSPARLVGFARSPRTSRSATRAQRRPYQMRYGAQPAPPDSCDCGPLVTSVALSVRPQEPSSCSHDPPRTARTYAPDDFPREVKCPSANPTTFASEGSRIWLVDVQ